MGTDYILAADVEKKKKYEKKKAECTKEIKLSPEQEKAIEELKKLNREIQQEQFKIHQLEQELTERQAVTKLEKCVEYLRGIIADEVITDVESEALDKYRKTENIDDDTYQEVLNKLDLTLMDVVVCGGCAADLKSASGPGSGTCPACHQPFDK